MTTISQRGLDKIIKCIDENPGKVYSYTIGQLLADHERTRIDYIDGTYTINYKNEDTMRDKKHIIGMSIVDFLYVEIGCNFPIQYTYSLDKQVYIKIIDKVLKRLEEDGIIKIGKNYITILKNSFDIAKEFERKYRIPWKNAYDIIKGIKEKSENYISDYT
jgi:hypothetical protein